MRPDSDSAPSAPAERPSTATPRPPWRPTPWVAGAAAFHLGVLAGLAMAPGRRRAALQALAAGHLLVGAAGLRPGAPWLGRSVVRLPDAAIEGSSGGRVALTLDDGPDPEVTPQVLDLLDGHDAKATFFVIGRRVEAHPQLAKEIVARGHRLENHTYRHRHSFAFLPYPIMRREIDRAQRAITDTVGRAPCYFRAPAGMRNVFVDPILHELDLTLVAWTRRGFDAVDPSVDRVMPRLCRGLRDGDILLLHDGNAARDAEGRPGVLETLPRLLSLLQRRGLRCVGLDDGL